MPVSSRLTPPLGEMPDQILSKGNALNTQNGGLSWIESGIKAAPGRGKQCQHPPRAWLDAGPRKTNGAATGSSRLM